MCLYYLNAPLYVSQRSYHVTHLKISENSKDMHVTHNSNYTNAKYLTTYLLQNAHYLNGFKVLTQS